MPYTPPPGDSLELTLRPFTEQPAGDLRFEMNDHGPGLLKGRVTDTDGNPLPGATVQATDQATLETITTTTNAEGEYRLPASEGTYHIACRYTDGQGNVLSGVSRPNTFTSDATGVIPDSGVARWTFDDADTNSGTAVDVWNGNDATINGAAAGVSGANQTYITNEAYSFDGSNDRVDTPVADTFSTFSWAYWVKYDTSGASEEDDFSTRQSTSGAGIRQRTGNISFYASGSGGFQAVKSSFSVNSGVWYHVVGVLSSSQLLLYVNGGLEGSTPFSGYTNGGNVTLGDRSDGGDHLTGDMDDPRIYDKALTDTEVSNLYNTGFIT